MGDTNQGHDRAPGKESTTHTDCTSQMESLDLALEAALPAAELRRLEAHLAGCAGCRAERRRLLRLREALAGARVPVRAGFRAGVMTALPAAAWERRGAATPRRAYAWAALLLVALGAGSALLFGLSGAAVDGAFGGPLAAIVELAGAALVAGAGLLGASWSGLGMAVGELFSRSPGTLVGFALLLASLALLLVTMLRRPRAAKQRQGRD